MLIRLSGATVTVFTVFVLVVMLKISHGDDYCARSEQEYYYKIGWTQSYLKNKNAGSKDAYKTALKLAEEDLIKYKQLKERTSNESEYNNYKRRCECIEGAIRLIKDTSYLEMWKTISGKPGDDGNLQASTALPNPTSTALPNPRFVDNGDGTITDNIAGLIWLKDANCFGEKDWNTAISAVASLASGSCGLTDGSVAGDWHLPEKSELCKSFSSFNIVRRNDHGQWLNNHGFKNVRSDWYWSSTVIRNPNSLFSGGKSGAWIVNMGNGRMGYGVESDAKHVLPVRLAK